MFIVAKKIRPGRVIAGLALSAVAIGFVGAGLGLAQDIKQTQAVSQMAVDPTGIKTNEDRVRYLERHGWLVADEPTSVEDILLPGTFDASYNDYLALQEAQGFDLRSYAGKTVKRYTYAVSNYPGLKEGIWACLLVYKKDVIGGEIYSCEGDGFTQGLEYPVKK